MTSETFRGLLETWTGTSSAKSWSDLEVKPNNLREAISSISIGSLIALLSFCSSSISISWALDNAFRSITCSKEPNIKNVTWWRMEENELWKFHQIQCAKEKNIPKALMQHMRLVSGGCLISYGSLIRIKKIMWYSWNIIWYDYARKGCFKMKSHEYTYLLWFIMLPSKYIFMS